MMGDVGSIQQAKLVLLGDMGAGKSSLVLRFVKGQFFDYQVGARSSPIRCLGCSYLTGQTSVCVVWDNSDVRSKCQVLRINAALS